MDVWVVLAGGDVRCTGVPLSEWAAGSFGGLGTAPPNAALGILRVERSYNLFDGGSLPDPALREGTLIVWSGTPATDLFDRDPGAWSPGAWEECVRAIRGCAKAAGSGGARVLVRPHARHVVSDVPRCRRMLEELAADGVGLALDPVAMLETSMLDDAPDHVERILHALGGRADAFVLTNARLGPDDRVEAAPLAAGLLDPRMLVSMVAGHVRAAVPVIAAAEPVAH